MKGGLAGVKVNTTNTFTTPTVTIAKHQLIDEGQQYPTPEKLKQMLATKQEAGTGVRVPFTLLVRGLAEADYADLLGYDEAVTPVFFEFEMMDGGKVVLKDVVITVTRDRVKALGEFATIVISGAACGVTEAAAMTVTEPA